MMRLFATMILLLLGSGLAKADVLSCTDTSGMHIVDVNTELEIWWERGNSDEPGRMKKTKPQRYEFSIWGGEGDVVLTVSKNGKSAKFVITGKANKRGSCINIPFRVG